MKDIWKDSDLVAWVREEHLSLIATPEHKRKRNYWQLALCGAIVCLGIIACAITFYVQGRF